jgi:transposase InsO family protein
MAEQRSKERSKARSKKRARAAEEQAGREARARDRALVKALDVLERRLEAADAEHRALRKRLKKLTKRLDRLPAAAGPRPGEWRGGPGRPPWAKGMGPAVSLEIPLETDDPTAPLWATVSARIPEEITAVGDDGQVIRFRYSAVGSTPQAPRYRRLEDPPERFPR